MSRLGGKSRRCKACRDWSEDVISRDDGRCTECGSTEDLHAHHILPWKDHEDHRFCLKNGQTLCRSCHAKETFAVNPLSWWKGKKMSESHRKAMSEARKGKRPWNKGVEYLEPENRECKVCGIMKDIEDFTPQGKYRTRMCKLCRNEKLRSRK